MGPLTLWTTNLDPEKRLSMDYYPRTAVYKTRPRIQDFVTLNLKGTPTIPSPSLYYPKGSPGLISFRVTEGLLRRNLRGTWKIS